MCSAAEISSGAARHLGNIVRGRRISRFFVVTKLKKYEQLTGGRRNARAASPGRDLHPPYTRTIPIKHNTGIKRVTPGNVNFDSATSRWLVMLLSNSQSANGISSQMCHRAFRRYVSARTRKEFAGINQTAMLLVAPGL